MMTVFSGTETVLKEDTDAEFDRRVQELSSLTEAQLQECVRAQMEPQNKKRGRQLLALNKQRALTHAERVELDGIHAKGDGIAITRIAAIWLLQSRRKAVELPK